VRRGITTEWSIELEADYRSRIVDGSLQFVVPGRTIFLAVWSPKEDARAVMDSIKREALEAQERVAGPIERFEEADPDELRYASWYSEPGSRGIQHALTGYTVRKGSYVQSTFISDSPDDLPWALTTWRSLRYTALT
jgi:hypothetical protein